MSSVSAQSLDGPGDARVHRIDYSVRGPEWAFAVPQGDLDALTEVMELCSKFWNGVGSLIVPVRSDGRVYPFLDTWLSVRKVESTYLHEGLGDRAIKAISDRLPNVSPMRSRMIDNEIHPLFLAVNNVETDTLWRPVFKSQRLARIATAIWGHIDDEDLPDWKSRFTLLDLPEPGGFRRLVTDQMRGTSVLLLGAQGMNTFAQIGGRDTWPHLFVFGSGSFNELVYFWNLRAHLSSWGGNRSIIGIPREALVEPVLHAVKDWVRPPMGGEYYKPDVSLAGPEGAVVEAASALREHGFEQMKDGTRLLHSFPEPPSGREELEFSLWPAGIGGPMNRGIRGSTLVTGSSGRVLVDLPAPEGTKIPWGYVRLSIHDLPLPLPMNSVTAHALIPNAVSSQDGLTVLTNTLPRWSWELDLPTRAEMLNQWSEAHGFTVVLSPAGRYAEALLGRLPSLDALDAIADRVAIETLHSLAPVSTHKMAQRVIAEAERRRVAERGDIDETTLVDLLREQGVLPTTVSKTLEQIASDSKQSPKKHLSPLQGLIEAGLIRRGVEFRCPQCNFLQLIPLAELDDTVACRACRVELTTPVVDGRREHPTSYFLDGLAARLVDQDLVPVLLALRCVRRIHNQGRNLWTWPGLEFQRDGERPTDADLVVSDGKTVRMIECKSRAEALDLQQTQRLIDLCEAMDARPGIAALTGQFSDEVVDAVQSAGGSDILVEDDLLSAAVGG